MHIGNSVLLGALIVGATGFPQILPPKHAVVVRQDPQQGEYPTIGAAVNALPNDTSSQTVFIYPGTYTEQVNVSRVGPTTLRGWTLDPYTYLLNTVTITNNKDATTSGSNDLSGTLRIESNNVSIYNLNIHNTFGLPRGVNQANQAIATSGSNTRLGMYGVSLAGYQDVLLANAGAQAYLGCKISGAIDFIFGRTAQAYFRDTTIEITAPANITASGKQATGPGIYLFEKTKIVKAPDAWANTTGNVFFGRPWGAYATVVFKDTDVRVGMNPRMWNPWHPGDERTDYILFAEYNTHGPGVPASLQRANYTTVLTREEAKTHNITSALGDDWSSWVDQSYLFL